MVDFCKPERYVFEALNQARVSRKTVRSRGVEHLGKYHDLDGRSDRGAVFFRSRTPGPSPFWGMNATPPASRAR
jgi:hypothetical protein